MQKEEQANTQFKRLIPRQASDLLQSDPQFMERFVNFAFDETLAQANLEEPLGMMAILAALMGTQGVDAFAWMADAALDAGVSPIELKEIVYQATAYLGFGKVLPFLQKTNELLQARGIALPLAGQATTTMEDRLVKGEQAQVDIFGESMRGFSASGPQESRHINCWLSKNCFGDYYTRTGLDLKQREMITFCFLAAQGGCEPQLTSHALGNMRIGNEKTFLIRVISQILPYIGYPRSLNALRCVNEAAKQLDS